MESIYPTTFYRVSIKAIIRNDKNKVLVVKEKGSYWSLPGGGMDHGESVEDTLKRELYEEILITSPFTFNLIHAEPMYVKSKKAWLLWLVCEIKPKQLEYGVGSDADEVTFIDPTSLRGSKYRSERLVYKFTVNATEPY